MNFKSRISHRLTLTRDLLTRRSGMTDQGLAGCFSRFKGHQGNIELPDISQPCVHLQSKRDTLCNNIDANDGHFELYVTEPSRAAMSMLCNTWKGSSMLDLDQLPNVIDWNCKACTL